MFVSDQNVSLSGLPFTIAFLNMTRRIPLRSTNALLLWNCRWCNRVLSDEPAETGEGYVVSLAETIDGKVQEAESTTGYWA